MDKTGKRTSAQISKNFINFVTNKLRPKSLTSAHVIILHGAEVNIRIELGAEVTSVSKFLVPNIDCPDQQMLIICSEGPNEAIPYSGHFCELNIRKKGWLL